jgi:hypothetical protein
MKIKAALITLGIIGSFALWFGIGAALLSVGEIYGALWFFGPVFIVAIGAIFSMVYMELERAQFDKEIEKERARYRGL